MVTLLAWMACEQEIELDVCTILKSNKGTHTKIGVLKETDEVSFASFLQGHDSGTLEPQVGLEVLGDLANKTLERELANQQLCGLLVPKNVRHQNIGNEEVHSITF